MRNERNLAHTRWSCKYRIVFALKYRRQVPYREERKATGRTLRKLCEWRSIRILGAECCADHIHMFVEIPPKMSVSGFTGYLKGKDSPMPHEQFGDLKFKHRNREFWCRGYYVDTVGENTAKIRDHIKHQLEEDKVEEQLSTPYPGNPFTGRKQRSWTQTSDRVRLLGRGW